jgi:hypothetical protein
MAEERKDTKKWSQSRPVHGSSTAEFKAWGKENPNRSSTAARTRSSVKSSEVTNVPRVRTKDQKAARSKEVQSWLSGRPEGGSRAEYVAWAAKNPNRVSNAARVGAAQTNAVKAAKKAAAKKTAPKKGKTK